MTKLSRTLTTILLLAACGPALAQVPIQPLDVPGIQGQYNSVIQQQNLGTQYNALQLQQNMTQDRIRELDLFRPLQPFGAATVLQPPQPLGITPLPPLPTPPPKPAPPAPPPPSP